MLERGIDVMDPSRPMNKSRYDKRLPRDRSARKIEEQPWECWVADQEIGMVADARGLDCWYGKKGADEGEDGGHDCEGAGGGEGVGEERDEEAGGWAEEGDVGEVCEERGGCWVAGWSAGRRRALGPEGFDIFIGGEEEEIGGCEKED